MRYKIEITETLQKIVTVDANDLVDALAKVQKDYTVGKIVLDSTDFVDYSIESFGEQ